MAILAILVSPQRTDDKHGRSWIQVQSWKWCVLWRFSSCRNLNFHAPSGHLCRWQIESRTCVVSWSTCGKWWQTLQCIELDREARGCTTMKGVPRTGDVEKAHLLVGHREVVDGLGGCLWHGWNESTVRTHRWTHPRASDKIGPCMVRRSGVTAQLTAGSCRQAGAREIALGGMEPWCYYSFFTGMLWSMVSNEEMSVPWACCLPGKPKILNNKATGRQPDQGLGGAFTSDLGS